MTVHRSPDPLDLDALDALRREANDLPWWTVELKESDDGLGACVMSNHGAITDGHVDGEIRPDDARYVVAAVNAVPALIARIRELEAALATATQTERARCLAICRNRQHARSKHSQRLREIGSHDQAMWADCKSTEAALCAEEIERGHIPPTQETP